jgi:hypothetical protein
MKVAVNNVAIVLQGLQKELARLIEASKEGQLSDRGKPEQFQGAFAEIVRGVNTMLDAILLPIGEGNRILAQISNGKIDELIAQTYKGDHDEDVNKGRINNVRTFPGPCARRDHARCNPAAHRRRQPHSAEGSWVG